MKKEKQKSDRTITLKVMGEGLKTAVGEFKESDTLQTIVDFAIEKLEVTKEGRLLRREHGTPLHDMTATIGDIGLFPTEIMRFFVVVKKPDRDKGWATKSPPEGYAYVPTHIEHLND